LRLACVSIKTLEFAAIGLVLVENSLSTSPQCVLATTTTHSTVRPWVTLHTSKCLLHDRCRFSVAPGLREHKTLEFAAIGLVLVENSLSTSPHCVLATTTTHSTVRPWVTLHTSKCLLHDRCRFSVAPGLREHKTLEFAAIDQILVELGVCMFVAEASMHAAGAVAAQNDWVSAAGVVHDIADVCKAVSEHR
jgi:hypothetical protein